MQTILITIDLLDSHQGQQLLDRYPCSLSTAAPATSSYRSSNPRSGHLLYPSVDSTAYSDHIALGVHPFDDPQYASLVRGEAFIRLQS